MERDVMLANIHYLERVVANLRLDLADISMNAADRANSDAEEIAALRKELRGVKNTEHAFYRRLEDIHYIMSGKAWTPDTLDQIAEVLRGGGFIVSDCNEENDDEHV